MTHALPVEELEGLANVQVGEALRLTRQHYGKTLEDIERSLRIRSCQIEAIEKGDVLSLPGRVYAIGFVRAYAEHLGMDGAKAVQLFKAQYMDGQGRAHLSFHVPVVDMKVPAMWMVTLSLILFSFILMIHGAYQENDRSLVETVEAVPVAISEHVRSDILETAVDVQDDIMVPKADSAPEDMGTDEPQGSGIILNIVEQSWVEIKDATGAVIVSEILAKGDQYFVPNSPGLSMSLGNAANVEIIVAGRALLPLGGQGDVRRDIPLDTAYLKTLEFKPE